MQQSRANIRRPWKGLSDTLIRQSFRAVLLELPYRLAPMFAPYLVFHVVDVRNMISNAMPTPLSPVEMITDLSD